MATRIPEIVVFEHANFRGREFRTNILEVPNVANLTIEYYPAFVYFRRQDVGEIVYTQWNMNDQISSIIVVSGIWQFFRDINFQNPIGPELRPDYYPWVGAINIPNDHISSFRCVRRTTE